MNSHEIFIHIHQGCFAGTGAIVRLPQCQWSKPDGYGKISQCIATTKHSKAKTVCIFLGIYCTIKMKSFWTLLRLDLNFLYCINITNDIHRPSMVIFAPKNQLQILELWENIHNQCREFHASCWLVTFKSHWSYWFHFNGSTELVTESLICSIFHQIWTQFCCVLFCWLYHQWRVDSCNAFTCILQRCFTPTGPFKIHCGLVMPYGNIEMGQHWLR